MDKRSEHLEFQLDLRQQVEVVQGRILIDEVEETFLMQIWTDSHEHPLIRFDVGPTTDKEALWPLLAKLFEFKRIRALGWREMGTLEWRPLPL